MMQQKIRKLKAIRAPQAEIMAAINEYTESVMNNKTKTPEIIRQQLLIMAERRLRELRNKHALSIALSIDEKRHQDELTAAADEYCQLFVGMVPTETEAELQ